MDSALRARLRELTPELTASLRLVNVHSVATIMWSVKKLNGAELDEVTSCTESSAAASKLLSLTYARGDPSIISFANALKDVELPELAEKLHCATATYPVAGATATEGSLGSGDHSASDMEDHVQLSKNLSANINYIAKRLTVGETDSIIGQLRSIKENYLSDLDYEDLKDIKGPTRKATALLDILKKNERAIPFLAKALKDIGRTDLCNVLLNGNAA